MNRAAYIAGNQSTTFCEVSFTKVSRAEDETTSRLSVASRMIRLVFKRGKRITEQRAKSWPGCPESVPVPVLIPTGTNRESIATPNSLDSSVPQTIPTTCTRPQRIRKWEAHSRHSDALWRQRQARCANCEELFFTSLSALSSGSDQFCSLDCKTNLEYVTQLQNVVNGSIGGWSDFS